MDEIEDDDNEKSNDSMKDITDGDQVVSDPSSDAGPGSENNEMNSVGETLMETVELETFKFVCPYHTCHTCNVSRFHHSVCVCLCMCVCNVP